MPAEMTLRDHFAAAALTGLLAQGDDGLFSEESYARAAYGWADVLLRCRAGTDCPASDNAPNLDAAPAARAWTPGTGDTQEPVAWGLMRVGGRWVSILNSSVQAETSRQSFDKMENWVHSVVPLYRHQQPTLTDAEREAIHEAAVWYEGVDEDERCHSIAATLRGLLERLK